MAYPNQIHRYFKKERALVLIADDSALNRSILADMLGSEYEVLEAENGEQTLALLQQYGNRIALLLLDIVMPGLDGLDVLAMMNRNHWIDEIPVIIISAENAPNVVARAYELGAVDYISRPYDETVVRRRAVNTLMLYAKQRRLVGLVADQMYQKERQSNLMVSILSHIVEFRNGESGLHVLHIGTMTQILLEELARQSRRYSLTPDRIALIAKAAAFHDIGKIAIPEQILNKPGPLTKEEFEVIKTHPMVGADMLQDLPFYQDEALVKLAYEVCRWHHERYDGRGYPDGLKGEEIPIAAQVVALADVYDALTSKRVYKPAYPHNQAMQMILNGECGAFNPTLLICLKNTAETIKQELTVNSLGSHSKREIQAVTQELLSTEEVALSTHTLQMLEDARIKYQFFVSVSREAEFEYTLEPPLLTLSDWSARKIGIPNLMLDPFHNEKFMSLFPAELWQNYNRALAASTPQNPIFEVPFSVNVRGRMWHGVMVCRSMWDPSTPPRLNGVIGKIVDEEED